MAAQAAIHASFSKFFCGVVTRVLGWLHAPNIRSH